MLTLNFNIYLLMFPYRNPDDDDNDDDDNHEDYDALFLRNG